MIIKNMKLGCIMAVIAYVFLAILFYYVGGDQIKYNKISSEMIEQDGVIGEILDNSIVQTVTVQSDIIESVTFLCATYARENTGYLNVQIIDHNNKKVLDDIKIDVINFKDNEKYEIKLSNPIKNVKYKKLSIRISATNSYKDNAITIYYNSKESQNDNELQIDGNKSSGELCFSITGKDKLSFGENYWYYVFIIGIALILYCTNVIYKEKIGKKSFVIIYISILKRYKFLIKQLVFRDFKTKYKRSVLGFLWSFLNPVLTMIIQYIVFSTLFKSSIPNFPVYLLTGIIFFNFFSESVSQGLMSIISNTSLITKVYVPKYLYPVTKVLSTSINLLISLVPLILAVVITGEKVTKSILILPVGVIFILLFSMGITLILSSAMVFFRDTQFLWNIVSMLWMYATPIIYPETILAPEFRIIHKINPLYYYINFIRTILLDGVSPQPKYYLICLAFSIGALGLGLFVFKKTQDKFILHI